MTREERLHKIAQDLYDINVEDKWNKKERETLVKEFFRLLEYDFTGRDHILPVKTIEVPDTFWHATGMSKEEFVESRFPGWDVEHCEYNIAKNQTVFVLKQNPHYIPGTVEVDSDDSRIRVSKEVAEYTPEIDWKTLEQERPDLFERLAKHTIKLEIDEYELEKMSAMEPEELATLQRHMRVKEPSLKVRSRTVKDGKETQQG